MRRTRARTGMTFVVLTGVLAAGGASMAAAHDGTATPKGHAAEDTVVHDAASETRLTKETRARTARRARAAAAAITAAPQDAGEWGPVVDWPVVGVHVALLPNGKVLAFDSIGDKATESYPNQ